MERRFLLSVTSEEYDSIRARYPQFNLPAGMASINIVEINSSELSVASMRSAITAAAGTTLPDLVVARTTDAEHLIGFQAGDDDLAINIPSSKGSISIIGFGTQPLTFNGAGLTRPLAIGASAGSTTVVNLGFVEITGGHESGHGGGVLSQYGTLTMVDSAIHGNWTGGNGGGLYASHTNLTLTNLTVSGNSASQWGGGVYQTYGTSTLTNARVSGNHAGSGGGMYQDYGTATLNNAVFLGNSATHSGGGFYEWSGYSTLNNVTIAGNSAAGSGGLYVGDLSNYTVNNSIIARNTAGNGPDIGLAGVVPGPVNGHNNLVGDGSGQQRVVNGVNGNLVGTAASPIDPQFEDTSSTDHSQWNLRLQSTSPAVDAGNHALVPSGITTDPDGHPRIAGMDVDMGAYEYPDVEGPTDLTLSAASVGENQPVGATVGNLSTSDPDQYDNFTYTLVSGAGSEDNSSFAIVGGQLRTAAVFDYEAQSSYSIRVRSTDQGGFWFEKAFTISVSDVTDRAPVQIAGTESADQISVAVDGSRYAISVNGDVSYYWIGHVASLTLNTLGGDDTVTVGAGVQACTIDGGYGNDSILSGPGNDFVRGDNGNDTIYGGPGDDTLMGNLGDDRLYGQDGSDQIQAGLGYDFLAGGIGNDSLYGGDQMDSIYGDDGDDYIEGKGKADTIYGGSGNDTILGGAGSDSIFGDDGDDRIWVGISSVFADSVDGGAGNDISDGDDGDVLSNVESVLA